MFSAMFSAVHLMIYAYDRKTWALDITYKLNKLQWALAAG